MSLAPARVSPELMRATRATAADLYIGHNLAALPAAVVAAKKRGAKVGFDAEDFHSGMDEGQQMTAIIEQIERRYLPQCDYVTAGSPQIAEAYSTKYKIPVPAPILNVFPLAERPPELRPLSPRSPLTLYWFSQTIGAGRGLEDVVRAMGLLPGCDIELHLRGNWQAGYQNEFLKLASSVGVNEKRIRDYAPAPADEMVSLATGYDVGLALEPGANKNNEIALSNKILTYLLAGNALIATATRAQEALVETVDKAGFCYEPGDIKTLAAQLMRWHDDRNLLEEARRQSWEYGATRYNWDVEKHKFLQVVKNVLQ
jgi:glycosyltransferase involved in cell wall biosynthesis